MKTLKIVPLALVAGFLAGCGKENTPGGNNPPVQELAAAPFTLTAVEHRGQAEYAWTVSREGVTDSVTEEVDDMYVTSMNSLVVTVTPEAGGTFAGFNVRSSNPAAVGVTPLDKNTFEIKRPLGGSSGEAVVEVWNGSDGHEQKVSFKVYSRNLVEPTHMVFLVDGKKVLVPVSESEAAAQEHYEKYKSEHVILIIPDSEKTSNYLESLKNSNDWDDIIVHEIVIQGLYPENTSFDYIEEKNHSKTAHSSFWMQWLEERGLKYTFDKFKGSISDFQHYNTCYVAAHVECTGFEQSYSPCLFEFSVIGSMIYRRYCLAAYQWEEYVNW